MKQFIIDVALYDSVIHILNSVTDDEFDKYCDRNFPDTEMKRTTSTAACWTVYDGQGKAIYLIDFRVKLIDDSYSINTINHESTHATIDILKRHKIGLVYDATDEVYCCLNGFISGEIYRGVYKK
jgi:hypothetical protein